MRLYFTLYCPATAVVIILIEYYPWNDIQLLMHQSEELIRVIKPIRMRHNRIFINRIRGNVHILPKSIIVKNAFTIDFYCPLAAYQNAFVLAVQSRSIIIPSQISIYVMSRLFVTSRWRMLLALRFLGRSLAVNIVRNRNSKKFFPKEKTARWTLPM